LEKYFTTNQKELLTLAQGDSEEGMADDDDDDDEWNQSSQSQVHVTVIRGN
jgi:hypothetical protein